MWWFHPTGKHKRTLCLMSTEYILEKQKWKVCKFSSTARNSFRAPWLLCFFARNRVNAFDSSYWYQHIFDWINTEILRTVASILGKKYRIKLDSKGYAFYISGKRCAEMRAAKMKRMKLSYANYPSTKRVASLAWFFQACMSQAPIPKPPNHPSGCVGWGLNWNVKIASAQACGIRGRINF